MSLNNSSGVRKRSIILVIVGLIIIGISIFIFVYTDPGRLSNKAASYSAQGDFINAITTYKDIIRKYPNNNYAELAQQALGKTYFALGKQYEDRDEGRKALDTFVQITQSYPNSKDANDADAEITNYINKRVQSLVEKNEFDIAILFTREFLDTHPNYMSEGKVKDILSQIYLSRNKYLISEGKYEDAIDGLDEFITLNIVDDSEIDKVIMETYNNWISSLIDQEHYLTALDRIRDLQNKSQGDNHAKEVASLKEIALEGLGKDSGKDGREVISRVKNLACAGSAFEELNFSQIIGISVEDRKAISCDPDLRLDESVLAKNLNDLRFVVSKIESTVDGRSCEYDDGYYVIPQSVEWNITITDITTGITINENKFYGPMYECPMIYTFFGGTKTYHNAGDPPNSQEVMDYISEFLKNEELINKGVESTSTFYSITSEDDDIFAVAGTFLGEYDVFSNSIEVKIKSAKIVFRELGQQFEGRERIDFITVGIATFTDDEGNWDIKYKSEAQPVNVELREGDSYKFPELITSTIPIDNSTDLSKYWLVFEITSTSIELNQTQEGYSYVHSKENIVIEN